MQKIPNWVLAAILIICGASVMTSCSSSEDNAAQGDGHAKKAQLVILDGWGIGDKSKPGVRLPRQPQRRFRAP